MRVELQRPDPGGGPPWVVRSFRGRKLKPVGGPAYPTTTAVQLCVQLARVYHGEIGWIDGENVFRPLGRDSAGAPFACSTLRGLTRLEPQLRVDTLLADVESPSARSLATAVWGSGGPALRATELRIAGHRERPALSRGGAFLTFASTSVRADEVSARFEYPGREQTLQAFPRGPFGDPSPTPPGSGRRGPVVITARAPDPSGGPSWGVGALRRGAGGWCLTPPARIVNDQLGTIDFAHGLWMPGVPGYACYVQGGAYLRRHAVMATYELGGGGPLTGGGTPELGRVEQRTLPGTTIGFGIARADVRTITITTPRDVRTLAPSGPAHAFLAVYDGSFPTGGITITAHFANGTSRVVDRFQTGGGPGI